MWRVLLVLLIGAAVVTLGLVGVSIAAARSYGPPAQGLGWLEVAEYSARLLWADGLLTNPVDPHAPEMDFEILPGESVDSVCERLKDMGLVLDSATLRDYLIYTGQDMSLQAGRYRLSGAMPMTEIAAAMQDATPTEVDFVILPGWRIEEIAAALPTSGLPITPEEFVAAAVAPRPGFDFLVGSSTTEGFLYPDNYTLDRATGAEALLERLLRGFSQHLDAALQQGFAAQSLSVRQAVILASIVQREAVQPEEAPLIASVYLNRLRGNMRLDADPTVQYALGFNPVQQTWWTNPLSLEDLKAQSPYNTYLVEGLPPAPISNPGAPALQAVANPAVSPYLFFNASCDGSGYHVFATTFEEHLAHLCP